MAKTMTSESPSVLIVDDEAIVRMDLADLFRDAGLETFEAGSAEEAIRIMEANDRIRVLFTDIDMPGSMDGLKLSHYVRDRWPPIRIIVASGHTFASAAQLPPLATFLPKPFQTGELDRIVRSIQLGA